REGGPEPGRPVAADLTRRVRNAGLRAPGRAATPIAAVHDWSARVNGHRNSHCAPTRSKKKPRMSGAVLKLEAVLRLLGGGDGSRGSFRLALRRGALRGAALLRDLLVLLLRRFRAGRSRGHGGLLGLFGRGARDGVRRRLGPGLRRGRRLLGESDPERQDGDSNESGKGLLHFFSNPLFLWPVRGLPTG